jgi:hypothetical protein
VFVFEKDGEVEPAKSPTGKPMVVVDVQVAKTLGRDSKSVRQGCCWSDFSKDHFRRPDLQNPSKSSEDILTGKPP